MGWFDDFTTRVSQAGQTAVQDIGTYIDGQVTNTTVAVATSIPGGNLTPAQIAAGMRGGASAQAAPTATAAQLQNAAQASQVAASAAKISVPLVLAAAAAAYFFFGGRRGRP